MRSRALTSFIRSLSLSLSLSLSSFFFLLSDPGKTVVVVNAQELFLDRFNYDTTVRRADGYYDYGPEDWSNIACDEENNLEGCVGYTDKWETGRGWKIEKNYCIWCPIEDQDINSCGRHHQSPIDLKRNIGIPGDPDEKECIDVHWMKYEDPWCTFDDLVEQDSFSVERHALRISQPISWGEVGTEDELRSGCMLQGRGRRFGRIDFSKGFSQWWFLSHIDVHVPSEHAQEGARYDGEIQMKHWYSVTGEEAGVDNELGTVSVFLKAYDDAPPYPDLDRVICEWRRWEYETRTACGLDPVDSTYAGCFPLERRQKKRNLKKRKTQRQNKDRPRFQTVEDVIIHNSRIHPDSNQTRYKVQMEPVNWEPPENKDWDKFIKGQSDIMKAQDRAYYKSESKDDFVHTNETTWAELEEDARKLIAGEELTWFNYFPMLGVRTEYYYRYSGSQTIPPCYGNHIGNSRKGTNHWRVLKDPIRIHRRQLIEMKRLLAGRISPIDSPVNACEPDTAVKINGDIFEGARPLQYRHPAHFDVFCECKDWPSKWPEDREWCAIEDVEERFYNHPYNFRSSQF